MKRSSLINGSKDLDIEFLSEEKELYDELRSVEDEDELLVLMSEIQSHFQEELRKQHEKYKGRRHSLDSPHDSLGALLAQTEDSSGISAPLPTLEASPRAGASPPGPTRERSLTAPSSSLSPISSHFAFHSATKSAIAASLAKSCSSTTPSPEPVMVPLMTAHTKLGVYRIDFFCNLKFVKEIFVRHISSQNEVLAHVTARTIAVLFSHSYLSRDALMDLAELLLGVHESFNPMENVSLTYRPFRSDTLVKGDEERDLAGDSDDAEFESETDSDDPYSDSDSSSTCLSTDLSDSSSIGSFSDSYSHEPKPSSMPMPVASPRKQKQLASGSPVKSDNDSETEGLGQIDFQLDGVLLADSLKSALQSGSGAAAGGHRRTDSELGRAVLKPAVSRRRKRKRRKRARVYDSSLSDLSTFGDGESRIEQLLADDSHVKERKASSSSAPKGAAAVVGSDIEADLKREAPLVAYDCDYQSTASSGDEILSAHSLDSLSSATDDGGHVADYESDESSTQQLEAGMSEEKKDAITPVSSFASGNIESKSLAVTTTKTKTSAKLSAKSPRRVQASVHFAKSTKGAKSSPFGTKTKKKAVPSTETRRRTTSAWDSDYESSSESSTGMGFQKRDISKIPFTVFWNNRLYSAMKILTQLVSHEEVSSDCIKALDEWFGKIVVDLFRRCSKAGFGILESFITLLKSVFYRFMDSKETVLLVSTTATALASKPSVVMDVVTRQVADLTTRTLALELCPLIANVCSEEVGDWFATKCLLKILEETRFNPFEPGDISMTRTFRKGAKGKMKAFNPSMPFARTFTVNEYVPSLLFSQRAEVFIDSETVMRLTFITVLKFMNRLARKLDEAERELEQKQMEEAKLAKAREKKTFGGLFAGGSLPSLPLSPATTPGKDIGDAIDFEQVERLDGEFDASTARKIRNFFSRDSEYTVNRIMDLCGDDDAVLVEVLYDLLKIENTLKRSNSRLAKRIRYLFDPFLMFGTFVEKFHVDYSLLLDWLTSNETSFLPYLVSLCKRMQLNWHPTCATQAQVKRVMCVLIRTRMHVAKLHASGVFPYNPKSLISAMERMEFCYETEGGSYTGALAKSNNRRFVWTDIGTEDSKTTSAVAGGCSILRRRKKPKSRKKKVAALKALFSNQMALDETMSVGTKHFLGTELALDVGAQADADTDTGTPHRRRHGDATKKGKKGKHLKVRRGKKAKKKKKIKKVQISEVFKQSASDLKSVVTEDVVVVSETSPKAGRRRRKRKRETDAGESGDTHLSKPTHRKKTSTLERRRGVGELSAMLKAKKHTVNADFATDSKPDI